MSYKLSLNDVYSQFNAIIRSPVENSDLSMKQLAINEGNLYLLKRMIAIGKHPTDLLTDIAFVTNEASVNYITLPDDFHSIFKVWVQYSTSWYLLNINLLSYETLITLRNQNFFNTADIAVQRNVAIYKDKLYFDRFFSATTGTDNIKIQYFKIPDHVYIYDRVYYTPGVTAFQVGETITGGTSGATATVQQVTSELSGATTLYYLSLDPEYLLGIFASGETITGGTSGATATLTTALQTKPQLLEWSKKYRTIIPSAFALSYFDLIGDAEKQERSVILDNLILQDSDAQSKERIRISINK